MARLGLLFAKCRLGENAGWLILWERGESWQPQLLFTVNLAFNKRPFHSRPPRACGVFFPGVSCIYIILVNKPANQRKTPQRHSNSLSSTHTFDKLLKSAHTRSCYEFTPCAGQKALPLTPALCPQDTPLPWSHMFPQSSDSTWKAVRGPSNVWGGDHVWMEWLRWCWRSRSVFSAERAGFRTGPMAQGTAWWRMGALAWADYAQLHPGAVHLQVKWRVSSRGSRRGHTGPVCFLGAVKLS